MSLNNQTYITLDSVVLDYLNEAELSNNKYAKIWQIAYRGMEDLGLDFFYKIQSVKLPINDNLTVNLPADYLQWTKVGVQNNAGEVIPLYYNDKLSTYADLMPDRLTASEDSENVVTGWDYNNMYWNYWNGYAYTNIYGVPSGTPRVGSFKIDTPNGVLLLNERYQYDYIILEYMASPQQGTEYYLPVQFREALISWIRWCDIVSMPSKTHVSNSSVSMRWKQYVNHRRIAIARWKPIRDYDMYQVSQEMTRLTVRS